MVDQVDIIMSNTVNRKVQNKQVTKEYNTELYLRRIKHQSCIYSWKDPWIENEIFWESL